jgi:hypothetical protein
VLIGIVLSFPSTFLRLQLVWIILVLVENYAKTIAVKMIENTFPIVYYTPQNFKNWSRKMKKKYL